MNHTTAHPTGITTSAFDAAPIPVRPRRLGRIVAASLTAGLVAGVLIAFAPFVSANEAGATGALLLGFALGWSMLAALSTRFTDQPQRWAYVPAGFMAASGVALIALGTPAAHVLGWVWPPALLAIALWCLVRARREALGVGARLMLYPLLGILAVASVGGGIETVLEARNAAAYPMAGELIDVDGHAMHLSCTGTGSPTVVLQPGGGEMSSNMGWIAPAVARDTRVCVYDRPGRGWSDPTDTPQDAARVAQDLHTLLHEAGVPGPYVLAGHSFGGLYVETYAAHYPQDVAGLVLIDSTAPSTPAPATQPTTGSSNGFLPRASALVSIAARVGLGRLYSLISYGSLPDQSRGEVRASVSTSTTLRSTIDEFAQASTSMQQAAELRDFGAKPLVVLTAGDGSSATWMASQDHLATLSTNVSHRTVAGASHEMLVADQRAVESTITAIRDVISSVRTGERMHP
jgi:pimeloyl-ACP methyl ester carboxylesterase